MFEEEVKLQKESSYLIPLVLILVLIVAIVGLIGYAIAPSPKLSQEQAAALVSAYLKEEGPATVRFYVGTLQPTAAEKIRDPHYRLLQKAGFLKLGKPKGDTIRVAFTPEGERKLGVIAGVVKTKNADGTEVYTVPLAERRLATISKVSMNGRDVASVQFTWQWAPNELGNAFDAAGPLVKSFNTWERSTLIEHYGAAFYHAQPAEGTLSFVRRDKSWKLAVQ